jgi:hypothetical protein
VLVHSNLGGADGVERNTVVRGGIFQDIRGYGVINSHFSWEDTLVHGARFIGRLDRYAADEGGGQTDAVAVHPTYTRNFVVDGCWFEGVRHPVRMGPCFDLVVQNCQARRTISLVKFGTHDPGDDGVGIDSAGYRILNNDVRELVFNPGGASAPSGSIVDILDDTANYLEDIEIRGNKVEKYGLTGGVCVKLSNANVRDLRLIDNNVIDNSASSSAHVISINGGTVEGLVIDGLHTKDITGGAKIVATVNSPTVTGIELRRATAINCSSTAYDDVRTNTDLQGEWINNDTVPALTFSRSGAFSPGPGGTTLVRAHLAHDDGDENEFPLPHYKPEDRPGQFLRVDPITLTETEWTAIRFAHGLQIHFFDALLNAALFGMGLPIRYRMGPVLAASKLLNFYYSAVGPGSVTFQVQNIAGTVNYTNVVVAAATAGWTAVAPLATAFVGNEAFDVVVTAIAGGSLTQLSIVADFTTSDIV